MYGLLNLESLVLGLIAWVLPIINLARRNKTWHNSWIVFCAVSVMACATSLCLQIFYQNHLVNIEDWSALMDTSNAVAKVSTILLVGTIALNIITLVVYFKKERNGILQIIKDTDGPTAVYYNDK